MKYYDNIPPRWITRLFAWLCRPAEVDDLLGDMEELYISNIERFSRRKAKIKYLGQCLVLVFSYTVKKRKVSASYQRNQWSIHHIKAMYFNYIKMVFRRFRTRLSFSLINIFGLGLGLAACFIITLFVYNEKSYDRFHQDHERMYRLTKSYPAGGQLVETAEMRRHFVKALAELSPVVEDYCRVKHQKEGLSISLNGELTEAPRVLFADANFFQFFSFNLTQGSPESVLSEPYTIALSESMVEKYFPSKNPIGKVMKVHLPQDGRALELKVTGVFEDMPENSHVHKDFVISTRTGEAEAMRGKSIRAFSIQHSYFKLMDQESLALVEAQIPEVIEQYAPDFFKRLGMELKVQAMTDIHLHSHMEGEFEANGSGRFLGVLSLLSAFILLMAIFNYINLATAQALDRAKEVGVRKVMGSHVRQLMARFITESMVMSLLGLSLAALLSFLFLPYFGDISGTPLVFQWEQHYGLALAFLLVALATGFVSGIYPSLVLSRLTAVNGLKGSGSNPGNKTRSLRKALVTIQFVISALLIVATAVIFQQFKFMVDSSLGFDGESVMVIDVSDATARESYAPLKQALLSIPEVASVSGATKAPLNAFGLRETNGIVVPGSQEEVTMNYLRIGAEFFSLYGIEFVIGQGYEDYQGVPLGGIVLNRMAMDHLGFNEENVLGQKLQVYEGYEPQVIGVVEDFHFEPLHNPIGPVYFQWMDHQPSAFREMSVRLTTQDFPATLRSIEEAYAAVLPSNRMNYEFLEDHLVASYQAERLFAKTFGLFSMLAMLLAVLGALGLAMQLAVARQKEVAVRKVLGASAGKIMTIMGRELLLLVLLANVIAAPIAYWVMNGWLDTFPYRTQIGPLVFLIGLLLSLLIALFSTGGITAKARLRNPVDLLRSE